MWSTEAGGRWAQFLHLQRPPCEEGSQAPHLRRKCMKVPYGQLTLAQQAHCRRDIRRWKKTGLKKSTSVKEEESNAVNREECDAVKEEEGDDPGHHRLIRGHGKHC